MYNFYNEYIKLINQDLINLVNAHAGLKEDFSTNEEYVCSALNFFEKYNKGFSFTVLKEIGEDLPWLKKISNNTRLDNIKFENFLITPPPSNNKYPELRYKVPRGGLEIIEMFENSEITIVKPNCHPIYDINISIGKSHLSYTFNGKCIIYTGQNYDFDKHGMPAGDFPLEELNFLFDNNTLEDKELSQTYQLKFDNEPEQELIVLVKTLSRFKDYIEKQKTLLS